MMPSVIDMFYPWCYLIFAWWFLFSFLYTFSWLREQLGGSPVLGAGEAERRTRS